LITGMTTCLLIYYFFPNEPKRDCTLECISPGGIRKDQPISE
jgi:hypothetical protein